MAQPIVSSCINYKWEYDVFLSFHGKDTRLGFVGFLHKYLRQRGIHVFYDDDSIRTGEEITPALLKAIQESRIAIIVFSENYADSTFCLRELEKILECFKEEGRLLYPVFYYVDPSELRRPRGSYAKALAGLEERFKDDKQKVERWRLALSQAANLKGCHLKSQIAKEQDCIEEIINEVSAKINRNHNIHVTHYPVGLMSRVKEVVSLLDLWSVKKNKMVGIVGPGGIGKSTIARATYNSIGDHFEGLCFLSDVRKMSKVPNGLAQLQEALLCKLVMGKDLKLVNFYEGIPKIKHRLGHKKILLILDDVDELEQLEALAGSCDWFGHGSRVVITTRNKQLLVSHDVNIIYSVRELNNDESLQLLSWHAFKTESVECDFMEVSKRATLYSCGFPLALEVIGSNLRGKQVKEWCSALDQFKKYPEERVLGVLRLSYDSLVEIEKDIFLDLACFFKGKELREVKDMLLCLHGSQPEYAIGVLVDKSLIKIEGDRVLMHGLIEDMGREIIRQESPNEPGKRSRLWSYEDILHVLKQNTGTDKVEVIVLDLPGGSRAQTQWSQKAFMKMTNLKMLVINNTSFSKCPPHLPKSLRWLKWTGYPFKFLPYNISSTELFCLDLSSSYFDNIQPFTKVFHNLSRMNFRNCKFLQQIPDFSGVSNLRELWFDGCTNLVEIHHSVGCLNKLKELSAMRCKNLEMLPPFLQLTSLEHLNLFGCLSLGKFPDISVEMKNMQTLDLGRTAITALPSSIRYLIGLETLNIEECPYLEQLPTTIVLLPNLWALNANLSTVMTRFKMCGRGVEGNLDCNVLSLKLEHFCFSNCNLSDESLALCLSCFTNVIRLDLSLNNFTTLPACIKLCHNLRYLLLNNCERLQHIEEMPPNLEKFSAICCKSLTRSSENKILYQALNLQPGKRHFILPGAKFPENLHNYGRGSSVSFWIRDVFPTIFLWILVKVDQDFLSNCRFQVHVNDTKLDISSEWLLLSTLKMGHLYICDLQSMIDKAELPHGYKWNHVKVSIKSNTPEMKNGRDQFHFALHVYKQQNNSETIRFMDPRTMYEDSNSWQRVQQPQDWEELEDELPYQDPAPSVDNLKAERALFPSGWTYDVFLSYRGDDECSSFFSHLYNSLCQRRIYAFVNDELVKTSGEELKAIKESRTAIIVISKNYVCSPYCLDSLVTILECFRKECQVIYPIFFDVEPLELKHQTGSYGEVFVRLGKIFKPKKEQVQKWSSALYEAVDMWRGISYLYPKNATGDKDSIESIISEISLKTGVFPLYVEEFPAPFLDEYQVQAAISLVDVESNEGVKIVGISSGGILRSIVTHAVCNSIAHHFEDLWYFCGVRETARGYDSTWDDFQNWITQPWFRQRKILVILDSVKELDQLRAVRECNLFGEGSRIIVATSDKQLLVSHGFEMIFDDKWNSLLLEKEKDPYELLLEEEEDLKAKRKIFPSRWTYDVFLSYRGGDECSSFVRLLYSSLCQRGVRVFINNELVMSSEEELKAIKESRTAIIVISKKYVSSPYCLNSFATILECCRIECRAVSLIFYDVNPIELRYLTLRIEFYDVNPIELRYWTYRIEFKELEKILKHNKEWVKRWKLALSEAVESRGIVRHLYHKNATGDKDAIELITDGISSRIGVFPLYVEEFPTPFLDESRLQEVISLVDIESNEGVKMVGISGGGIRREIITHAVCNSIAHHFEDLWYFCGVREIARGYDSTWDDFQNWITQPWFPQRKILVILDSVKELDQLRAVRESNLFGEGSRIIVATSDKQLLVNHGFEIIFDDEWNSLLLEKEKDPFELLLEEEEDLKAKRKVFPSRWTYDVFLSYRGDNECSSFVCLLYNSLCQQGVRVFVNNELVMSSGEELRAIKESKTAIIVISIKYVSSPYCLDSLVKILECCRIECRVICPIFYNVEPLELKHQTGSYGEVFARLEKIFRHNKERVKRWKLALSKAVESRDIVRYLYRKYLLTLFLSYSPFLALL